MLAIARVSCYYFMFISCIILDFCFLLTIHCVYFMTGLCIHTAAFGVLNDDDGDEDDDDDIVFNQCTEWCRFVV